MAQVTVYTGTSRSGRSDRIDGMLASEPESTRLIVPTQRGARQRMQDIVRRADCDGILGRSVVTFEEFASSLLKGTPDDLPLVSRTTQTLLLKRAVEKAYADGLLEFLGEAGQSPGFLNHIQHVIAQLKQGAVKPADFRERIARRDRPSAFDGVVAEIYSNYQNALVEAHTFDLQGMYWLADLACQYTKPMALEGISTLLIDGFDDFTPSEFTLIQSVKAHVEHLVFGLNYDTAPDRGDAYALLRETHGKVRGAFECTEVNCEDDRPEPESTCEQIVTSLFWRDASLLRGIRSDLKSDLTLMPCHTVTHEVESAARWIKRRIVEEGVNPSDILVVLKNADVYARILGEVFDEAGIPLRPVQSATLAESSYVDMLLKVYETSADWERDAVLGVLTSGEFQSLADSPEEHVAAYRHAAYRAGIVEGRLQWRKKALGLSERLLARQGRTADGWLNHVPHLQEACASLILDIARLETLSRGIPSSATFSEHTMAFGLLHGAFTLERVLERTGAAGRESAFHAWHELQAVLHSLGDESQISGQHISRSEYVRELRDLFSMVSLPEHSGAGGVLCLRLEDARHIRARYVYGLGMNEGIVPSAPPVSAIYSEADYGDLRKAGLDLDMTRTHGLKERLLFLRLFSVATEHLTIGWHESTQQGQVIYPSPFVQDIRDLGEGYGLPLRVESEPLTWPMNAREALCAGVEAKAPLLPELEGEFGQVSERVSVERGRYAISAFNEFDGVLNEPRIIEEVAGYYDTRHRFSANQIETYIDCPFRFMMNKILEIPSLDRPERGLDVMTIGTIYHHVLEKFYRKYLGTALEVVNLDEAFDVVEELTDDEFKIEVVGFAEAYPGVARVERNRIVETLRRHVRVHHENGSEGWLAEHFEVSFGESLTEYSDSMSVSEPFSLEVGGETFQFTGRLDRVDVNADRSEARLVDYKSSVGSISKGDIKEGRNIQLTLYAMVLESLLLEDGKCAETQYLKVGSLEKKGTVDKDKSDTWTNARVALEKSIRGIQAGVFYPKAHEKACKYCPENKVCRFEEGRIAGKTAP